LTKHLLFTRFDNINDMGEDPRNSRHTTQHVLPTEAAIDIQRATSQSIHSSQPLQLFNELENLLLPLQFSAIYDKALIQTYKEISAAGPGEIIL
jgi:hypothetical protein